MKKENDDLFDGFGEETGHNLFDELLEKEEAEARLKEAAEKIEQVLDVYEVDMHASDYYSDICLVDCKTDYKCTLFK